MSQKGHGSVVSILLQLEAKEELKNKTRRTAESKTQRPGRHGR